MEAASVRHFSLSLKGQEETNYKCQIFGFPDSSVGKELPTPVSWPGEFHEPYGPWGSKELDTTEELSLHQLQFLIT